MEGELFYQDATITLYIGDAVEVLRTLPAASVHCVVTSPPFWRLRNPRPWPDPLHLTAVFGISERAAIRYADIARQLLEAPGAEW